MTYFAPRPLLGLLAATTATLACAADAVPRTDNIAAGPLNAVIARFSVESGVYVAADGALTGNKTSPGVEATLAPHDALTRLLAGSGLEAVLQGAGRYILRQGAGSQAAARTGVPAATPLSSLPAVTVSGERETALGHVDGYVARRSATATKTDSRLIDNPQSVSVVTADELADRKVETLDEALRYTAGVTPNMKPWAVDEFSMLRGFELGTAGIFRDGLLTSGRAYAAPIEPYGLERLEVLRGPASVLCGQSPPGGMINAVSKRPSASAMREMGIEYGTYDRKQVKADLGGAIDDQGAWLWRVTMLAREAGTRLDLDRDDRDEFEHRFNDTWSVQQNVRYTKLDRHETNVFPRVLQANGTMTRLFYPRSSHWRGLQGDTRAQAAFRTGALAHNVLVGVDYADNKTVDRFPYAISPMPALDLYNPVYGDRQAPVASANPRNERYPLKQVGLYVQDQVKWDQSVVTAGLRRDRADNSNTQELPRAGTASQAYDQSASKTTGRVGAVYLMPSGWAPYVSWSTSFSPEIGRDINNNLLKPSTGRQLEAGLRYQPDQGNVSYTASVFNLLRKNVTTAAAQDPDALVQSGEVRSRGLELEARADLVRNLTVVAQYTYLDTDITESNNGERGLPQQGAVKHSASVWTRYQHKLNDTWLANAGMGQRCYGKARSSLDYDNVNLTNPSFGMLDLAFGLEQKSWRYALNFNNVLDKQVLLDCDGTFCYRSAERTVNVSASYRF